MAANPIVAAAVKFALRGGIAGVNERRRARMLRILASQTRPPVGESTRAAAPQK